MTDFTINTWDNEARFDRLDVMWQMVRLVRRMDDTPQLWKLNDPFLEALAEFMKIEVVDTLFDKTFLDAGIEVATAPYLVAAHGAYPFSLIPSYAQ